MYHHAVAPARRYTIELKRYDETDSFTFGNLVVRDMTPSVFTGASFSEIEVPIGADNPPYAAAAKNKVYIGVTGEIEFKIDGIAKRLRRGDVLVIERGEQYQYHNGGYEMGRLLVIEVPAGEG
jgi:mannose-6-phosphate isomerase-like protein (cupin superfamily)